MVTECIYIFLNVFSDLFLLFIRINIYSMPVMVKIMWEAYLNYKVRQRLYSKKNDTQGDETKNPENNYV